MAIEKPQNCTTRPGCNTPPTASFVWSGKTQFACGAHLQDAERVANALRMKIDPQPYPPPKPTTKPAEPAKSTRTTR